MLPLRSRSLILPGILALTLLAAPAYSAVVTTYTSMASWQAAANSLTAIDFASQTLGAFPNGQAISFIQFSNGLSGSNVSLDIMDTAGSIYFDFGTGRALEIGTDRPSGTPAPYIHMVLPAAVTAIGFNLFSASPTGLTFTVTTPSGTYSAPTFAKPTLAFWGITSDTPITTLDLTLQGTVFNGGSLTFVDNIQYGAAAADAPVPEAATCVTIGSGLLALGLLRKRRGPPLAVA